MNVVIHVSTASNINIKALSIILFP